jgi:hypothetical protein
MHTAQWVYLELLRFSWCSWTPLQSLEAGFMHHL